MLPSPVDGVAVPPVLSSCAAGSNFAGYIPGLSG